MAAQFAPPPIAPNVMVVGGTHGNERNAPWLLEFWRSRPQDLASQGLGVSLVLGNPGAHAVNRRYLERDLNRSFHTALWDGASSGQAELVRARELVDQFGPAGLEPCSVVLDLHSTTSSMGNCLVVYGRRPVDLALAAGIQAQLGLPVYLHEADGAQTGFLVERWPCGLVIEVGPVPQGVLQSQICRQSQLAVEAALAVLADAADGVLRLPKQLVVHRHLASVDLPRHGDGSPAGCIHPQRQGRDWHPMGPGEALFIDAGGQTLAYGPPAGLEHEVVWPVFINEAAYGEKGIALSLTRREGWPLEASWGEELAALARALDRQSPVP
ncbi:MAG: aspartoacylase [Cyanobium sp. LacPavin_0920_WC12_MAG_62_9]|nr:aspartoacylase [Cyanobium sp. LacPavin_0920_WC12_MAG_62_9]